MPLELKFALRPSFRFKIIEYKATSQWIHKNPNETRSDHHSMIHFFQSLPSYVHFLLFAPYGTRIQTKILNIIAENQEFCSIVMRTHIVEQMDCDRNISFWSSGFECSHVHGCIFNIELWRHFCFTFLLVLRHELIFKKKKKKFDTFRYIGWGTLYFFPFFLYTKEHFFHARGYQRTNKNKSNCFLSSFSDHSIQTKINSIASVQFCLTFDPLWTVNKEEI